jgi:hypothetical protein
MTSSDLIFEDQKDEIIESFKAFNPYVFKSSEGSKLSSSNQKTSIENIEISSSISSEVTLTALEVSFLEKLDIIVSELKEGLDPAIAKILLLEDEIGKVCSIEEQNVLLTITSVTKHSLSYWSENYEKWMLELGGTDGFQAPNSVFSGSNSEGWDWFWDSVGNSAKSDAVGAGIGFVVGLSTGPGAVPAAIGAGLYSSAGRGIVSLLDRWNV